MASRSAKNWIYSMGKSLKEMPKKIWDWQVKINKQMQEKIDKQGRTGVGWPG